MRKNRIVSGFSVLALAVGLVCLSGLAGTPASAAGSYKVLHNFDGSKTDGATPFGSLILSGGNLYGMTTGGGTSGSGTIFEFNIKTKQLTVLHNFDDSKTDGAAPYGSLILSGTNLYGMTIAGGSADVGTIFEFNIKTSQFALLHSFQGEPDDGAYPRYGNLIFSRGNLYGMATIGVAYDTGTIFEFNVKTRQLRLLHSFWGGDGADPLGSLILSGQNLYGMASGGSEGGHGLIFMVKIKNSQLTPLHSFEGGTTDGACPVNHLTLSGKNLYGMTCNGGQNDSGTIFTLNPGTGAYSLLYDFTVTPADGDYPNGSLLLSGTTLYGMTTNGGANNDGVIFSYSLK